MDMDQRGGRTDPSGEGGNVASKGGVIDFINEDTEESGSLITRIRLKARVNLNDER